MIGLKNLKMKKLIFLTAFVATATLVFAQGTKFYQGTFVQLQANASKNNLAYYVYLFSEDCITCANTDTAFQHAGVAEFANKGFPGMKVAFNSLEGSKIAQQFAITKVPALIFLGSSGSVFKKVESSVDHKDLLGLMQRYAAANEMK